ncbi:hypothetical protein U1Q18_009095 [Sarracenia purpurea var. burkii]
MAGGTRAPIYQTVELFIIAIIKNMENGNEEAMGELVELWQTSNVKDYKRIEFKIGVQKYQSLTMDQDTGLVLLQEMTIKYPKSIDISHKDDAWSLDIEDDDVKMNVQGKEATNHIQTSIKVLMCKNTKNSINIAEQEMNCNRARLFFRFQQLCSLEEVLQKYFGSLSHHLQ